MLNSRSSWQRWGIPVFVITAGFLLFFRLGYHSLWDDEANTALFAESVWKTGDMNAAIGHNLIAFRNGAELKNLRNRYLPPLPYYIAAPFVGLFGRSTFWVRFPFALLGLFTILLLVRWLRRVNAPRLVWLLAAVGMVGNVSFHLYARQCRYYAVVLFLSVVIAYLYLQGQRSSRNLVAIACSLLAMLATNYLTFAALCAALVVDYTCWGRREFPLGWRQRLLFLGSILVMAALVFSVWNPVGKAIVHDYHKRWAVEKATLLWWNIRDINACEFGSVLSIVAALILGRMKNRPLMVRGVVAAAVLVFVTTVFSPQPVAITSVSDVRYLIPLIPLCVFLTVGVLSWIAERSVYLGVGFTILLFLSNTLNALPAALAGAPRAPLRSTLACYIAELLHPPSSPYAEVARWIHQNVAFGRTILVRPSYAVYPLMYHAPQQVYAWQLDNSQKVQFPHLADIHFRYRAFPDLMIALGSEGQFGREGQFGWYEEGVKSALAEARRRGFVYALRSTLSVPGRDMTRPELFWHSFSTPKTVPAGEEIQIFQRIEPSTRAADGSACPVPRSPFPVGLPDRLASLAAGPRAGLLR